jgi:peptide/nickel transport system ATP-binding protein
MSEAPLLTVRNLRLSVRTDEGLAQILDHVELALPRGKILGVVGESGCGKSTLARAVLGIVPRTATIDSGEILFEGEDLLALDDREMTRRVRGRRMGFIPQDPYLALNPVFKIGAQLLPVLRWHAPPQLASERDRRARLVSLLRRVQIPEPEAVLERYPHQFSGGQRQRLMIAGALACSPALVIADEPTTALDVTTQLQILKLLKSLTEEFGIAMLFVTHDLGVVAQLCDAVTVMYAGQTVEAGPTPDVLADPRHPYTRALLACHPDRSTGMAGIPGLVPSPLRPPPGCRFTPRCPHAAEVCSRRTSHLVADAPGRLVSCRLADERQRAGA